MAYKALYREYRPDNFDGVVGQTAIVKTLQNIVKDGKISHAYLFSGPRGTGKTSVAKIFAKAINCLNPKDGGPCGTCAICTHIKTDEISDIIEIDAASNNGVDEIRELKSKVNLAPSTCKYKVYIIDEVHMLSIGAFNALLKTLEEPPHHAVFILATTEMHKLPLTIISRCQNYNFRKITEDQMYLRLRYIIDNEKIKIEEDAIHQIISFSDGGMRDAIGLLEQLISFTDNNITAKDADLLNSSISQKELASLVDNINTLDVEKLFEDIEKFYSDGKDFAKINEDLVIFLKDALLYKKAKSYFVKHTKYDINEFEKIVNKLSVNKIYQCITELNQATNDLKVSNQPKIIFEITLLKLLNSDDTELPQTESLSQTNDELIVTKIIESAIPSEKDVEQVLKIQQEVVEEKRMPRAIETEPIEQVDDFLPNVKVPLFKKILINNTLATADKSILSEIKAKSSQIQTFMINKDFKVSAQKLIDAKVVGASSDKLIYTYLHEDTVESCDEMLSEIEALINNIMGKKFHVINITEDSWQELRPYFVKLVKDNKEIAILPEVTAEMIKKSNRSKKKSKEIDEAIDMFGEDFIEIK